MHPKRYLILGAVMIVIAGVSWALYPLFLGDGANNFKGESHQAAGIALDEVNEASSTGLDMLGNIGVLQRRVEAVSKEAPPSDGVFSRCKDLYVVSVEDIGWFGRQLKAGDRAVCLD